MGRRRLNVNLNVSNLFDNDVSISFWDVPFRDALTRAPLESFFSPGFDPIATTAASSSIRPDPRSYGGVTPARSVSALSEGNPMDRTFLSRRSVRLGMKISF